MKRLGRIWTVIVYLFLYAPMFILFIGSFNDGKDLSEFEGFTLGNYADLFRNSHLVGLLGNSVLLALCSAVLATLLGTLAALGIKAMRGRLRRLVMSLTNIPLVNPEIVTGVSLALLFVFIGRRMLSTENVFGFATLLIAHVTFCLPYVILSVMPKLHQLDPSLMDAAQDLGCTPLKGFFKVVLPELTPGIVSGAIRLRHLLLRLRAALRHPARGDLHLHAQAGPALALRDVHTHVLPYPHRHGRHEHHPGPRREEAEKTHKKRMNRKGKK